MHQFFVLLLFPSLFFNSVSSVRLPLMDKSIRVPLFVDIDVSNMNQELKGYIDNGIEKEVNDTCYQKIETVVTHRNTELKTKMLDDMSSLAQDFKLQFKQLVQNLKNENEVLKKELQEKNKEINDDLKIKSDTLFSKVNDMFTDTKKTYDIDFSTLDQDIKSMFKQLELNSTKENEAFKTQAEKRNKAISENLNNQITELNKKVISSQKRVALTACISDYSTRPSGYVWKFDDVRSQTGINNLSSFKSTGKFTCESDGLYLVSAWIMSKSYGSEFYIYKNSNRIVNTYITSSSRSEWYTSTAVVAVELQVHDTVWVSPVVSMYAHNEQGSCLTIVKIK